MEGGPTLSRRLAALSALLLSVVAIGFVLSRAIGHPARTLAELILLAVFVSAAWVTVIRTARVRVVASIVTVVAVVALVWTLIGGEGSIAFVLTTTVALMAIAIGLGRYALGTTMRALASADVPGTPVPPAQHGVLFMNLRSGGGKAERFDLVDACRARGIEPVVLESGEDWPARVREVASAGVDVLGMAGGDGSQAMVAAIAAELGLSMVVVPAGTRNHLALDLGLDREDVIGALDAYGEAVERPVDLADVNGRVFVNNVSLGLYAAIVASPEYRDAKVDTTLSTLPEVFGPDTEPFDLRFVGPDGTDRQGAHVIQISNNPYGDTVAGLGSRPRLDTRRLGIVSLVLDDKAAPALLAATATGRLDRFPGFDAWTAPTFEVTSGEPVEIGLDGETEVLDPPLRFSIRPQQVRVRLPRHAPGYSPAARSLGWRQSVRELWGVALGRPSRFASG
jgi:diacylglycerol kinase family enzyme